ncbi:MAG: hypothetical protein DDT37_01876 [Firmicutes bacterium]|nr:hypothetical protein [candidate division NPL-UPA2 bacterium]
MGRVEDVAGLVNAELREDHGEFLLEHLTDPMFDRILKDEVDRADGVRLPDAINPANSLLEPHRVPGDVVVDHHMTELEVQALPAGVSGDKNAGIFSEG